MKARLQRTWRTPWMMRWGRLALISLAVAVLFLFFTYTEGGRDGAILVSIAVALSIGVLASIVTTEKYHARSLGLVTIVFGSAVYFTFLYLMYTHHPKHLWMQDLTRACFVVGAPIFAVATTVAMFKNGRSQWHDERGRDVHPTPKDDE